MKKKILSTLLCVALTAGVLAGCGGSGAASTGEAPKEEAAATEEDAATDEASEDAAADEADADAEALGGTITFMAPDWAIPTDEQLDQFTASTGINVEVSEVGWDDIREKLATAAAAGQSVADVVEVDWSWVGEFNAAGWLAPLEVDDAADFLALDTFSVDGQIMAVPYANDYRLAYYNKDHFEKAGITEEPKTYEDILNACKALKASGIDAPLALALNAEEKASTGLMWTAFHMNNKVWNDDGTFDEASLMDALNYYEQAIEEGYVAPEDKTSSGKEAYLRLAAGTASILVGPTFMVGRVQNPESSQVVDQVEPIICPGKTDKATVTMALPEALGVMESSENKEAAKKFVEWYTSVDMQKGLYDSLGSLPTRKSVLGELIDNGTISNPGAMLEQADLIKSPFPNGVPSYYAQMSSVMYNAVNKMALGQLDAKGAYDEMSKGLDEILSEQ